MPEQPVTRPSLLVRIRDAADKEAWRQFVEIYAPLVYGLARKQGLQDADAADVTQDVLAAVAAASKRLEYDPRRGTFRGWLYTVARNKLNDFRERQSRRCQGTGDSAAHELLEKVPARDEDASDWDREHDRRVFRLAAEQVRADCEDSTWQAFWQVAVEGKSGEEAAALLGMSVGAIYVAKSRVLARLKQQVRQFEDE
ncbi:MAG: sigma-70 family RNA polymerase sigma factor [Planctomycetes bacterium]|nr:sigma-70 family RNA polymerase sigma factor [Planctomycetota bacterium]